MSMLFRAFQSRPEPLPKSDQTAFIFVVEKRFVVGLRTSLSTILVFLVHRMLTRQELTICVLARLFASPQYFAIIQLVLGGIRLLVVFPSDDTPEIISKSCESRSLGGHRFKVT